jgi:hypothetical protein
LQIKFRAKTKKPTSKSPFFLPVRRPKTSVICVSGRFGVHSAQRKKKPTSIPIAAFTMRFSAAASGSPHPEATQPIQPPRLRPYAINALPHQRGYKNGKLKG